MSETPKVEFFESTHRYKVNGQWVPSVTTVLGMFDKPGVPYWVQTIVTRNVAALHRRKGCKAFESGESVMDALTKYHLTFRDESGRAADRGLAIHSIFEQWGERQVLPNPNDYPEAVRPYLRSLAQFLVIEKPTIIKSEVMVGSAKYGYAGRMDATVKMIRRDGGVTLADIKTSKRVYPKTMFAQIEAYEGAQVECGGEPTDKRAIVHIGADGKYDPATDFAYSTATFDDFLAYLDVYNRQRRIERDYRKVVNDAKPKRPRKR